MSHSVEQRLQSFLEGARTEPPGRRLDVELDRDLLDGSVLDSLGLVTLIEFVESTFGIRVDDEDLTPDNFATIRRLSSYVRSKLGVNGAWAAG